MSRWPVVRRDLIGRRFFGVRRGQGQGQDGVDQGLDIRKGVIRASTHADCSSVDAKILVEYDDGLHWKARKWISIANDFDVFFVEDSLVGVLDNSASQREYQLAFEFMMLVDKIKFSNHLRHVEFLLPDRPVEYVPNSRIVRLREEDYVQLNGDQKNRCCPMILSSWMHFQQSQHIMINYPSRAVGHACKVYSLDNITQWYIGRISGFNENTKFMTVIDEKGSERKEHCALVHMELSSNESAAILREIAASAGTATKSRGRLSLEEHPMNKQPKLDKPVGETVNNASPKTSMNSQRFGAPLTEKESPRKQIPAGDPNSRNFFQAVLRANVELDFAADQSKSNPHIQSLSSQSLQAEHLGTVILSAAATDKSTGRFSVLPGGNLDPSKIKNLMGYRPQPAMFVFPAPCFVTPGGTVSCSTMGIGGASQINKVSPVGSNRGSMGEPPPRNENSVYQVTMTSRPQSNPGWQLSPEQAMLQQSQKAGNQFTGMQNACREPVPVRGEYSASNSRMKQMNPVRQPVSLAGNQNMTTYSAANSVGVHSPASGGQLLPGKVVAQRTGQPVEVSPERTYKPLILGVNPRLRGSLRVELLQGPGAAQLRADGPGQVQRLNGNANLQMTCAGGVQEMRSPSEPRQFGVANSLDASGSCQMQTSPRMQQPNEMQRVGERQRSGEVRGFSPRTGDKTPPRLLNTENAARLLTTMQMQEQSKTSSSGEMRSPGEVHPIRPSNNNGVPTSQRLVAPPQMQRSRMLSNRQMEPGAHRMMNSPGTRSSGPLVTDGSGGFVQRRPVLRAGTIQAQSPATAQQVPHNLTGMSNVRADETIGPVPLQIRTAGCRQRALTKRNSQRQASPAQGAGRGFPYAVVRHRLPNSAVSEGVHQASPNLSAGGGALGGVRFPRGGGQRSQFSIAGGQRSKVFPSTSAQTNAARMIMNSTSFSEDEHLQPSCQPHRSFTPMVKEVIESALRKHGIVPNPALFQSHQQHRAVNYSNNQAPQSSCDANSSKGIPSPVENSPGSATANRQNLASASQGTTSTSIQGPLSSAAGEACPAAVASSRQNMESGPASVANSRQNMESGPASVANSRQNMEGGGSRRNEIATSHPGTADAGTVSVNTISATKSARNEEIGDCSKSDLPLCQDALVSKAKSKIWFEEYENELVDSSRVLDMMKRLDSGPCTVAGDSTSSLISRVQRLKQPFANQSNKLSAAASSNVVPAQRQSDCEKKMSALHQQISDLGLKFENPSAALSMKKLNSFSQSVDGMRTYIQDRSCLELSSLLLKCRECKFAYNSPGKQSLVLCRFHAFRRLKRNTKGVFVNNGFSNPTDADAVDISLWMPMLPITEPQIDVDMAKYIVKNVGNRFCELVEQEKDTMSAVSSCSEVAWKRAVNGVREMCDVCSTTLFNIHWVCRKCGYVACLDCYRTAMHRCSKSRRDTACKSCDVGQFKWAKCSVDRQPHQPTEMMLTQIIPSDVLWVVGRMIHDIRKKWSILENCPCGEDRNLNLSDNSGSQEQVNQVTQSDERVSSTDNHELASDPRSPTDKPRDCNPSDKTRSRGAVASLRRNQSVDSSCDKNASGKNLSCRSSSRLKELLLVKNCEFDRGKDKKLPAAPNNSLDDVLKRVKQDKLSHPTPKVSSLKASPDSQTMTGNSVTSGPGNLDLPPPEDVPHIWLDSGRLLQLLEPRHPGNLRKFQDVWQKGKPVLISNCDRHITKELWLPEAFAREFGDMENDLVDCAHKVVLLGHKMRHFWQGFEKMSARLKDSHGEPMILKLKDWPPMEDFSEMLPTRFEDLLQGLPLPEYTHRAGVFNLASRLPEYFVRPDLGPKMYNAYGSALHPMVGSTNLHLDVSDAVNLILYVGIPKDDTKDHEAEAIEGMRSAGCCDLTMARITEEGHRPGALWHIFDAKDSDKIRALLTKVGSEIGEPVEPHHDPIHDQSWYLDETLRQRLLQEYSVQGYTLVQCIGDAIFIPAGAPHQVRNFHSCIKAAEDFVSPENLSHCFQLTQEFRHLSDTHSNHEDKLQVKNIIYHAVKDAIAVLQNTEPDKT